MKRILMLAFAAALSLGASACQDTTSPGTVLSGTYTLRTVNGQQPPVILTADPTGRTEVIAGEIQIDRDGTYTDVVTYRDTPTGGPPGIPYDDAIYGTWALSGSTLQFTDSQNPGLPYYATVEGGELYFVNVSGGVQYTTVYSK
jgi:hypothetical protein